MIMSPQAIILTVCNIVILIALILSLFVIKKSKDSQEENKVKTILKNIAALIMFLIIMVMQIYSLNCMVYGDCTMWSWILTAFAIFGTLAYIGFFAYVAMTAKTVQNNMKDMMRPDAFA